MNQSRIASIQGLRAIAVLLVVTYHATDLFTRGFIGVDIFFVISGFVITGLIKRTILENDQVDLVEFWKRRFFRLIPALAIMLMAVVIGSLFLESWHLEQRRTQESAIAALFSFSNWKFSTDSIGYFSLDSATNPLLHTWSLSVEEQFYLVFPIMALMATKIRRKTLFAKQIVVTTLCGLIVGSLALQIYQSGVSQNEISQTGSLNILLSNIGTPFYGTPSRIWQFLAGTLAYLSINQFRKVPLAMHIANQKIAPWILVFAAFNGSATINRRLVLFYVLVVALTALALISIYICSEQEKNKSTLQAQSLIWIGDRSYSWYLWHMPFIVFSNKLIVYQPLAGIVGATASLLVAALSFRYIEARFREQKNKRKMRSKTELVFASSAAAIVFSFAFFVFTPRLERSAGTANPIFANCDPYKDPCIDNKESKKQSVLLLEGDSHAASISGVIKEIALKLDLRLVICLKSCVSKNDLNQLINNQKISTIISMRQYPSIPSDGFELIESIAKKRPELDVLLIADNPQFEEWIPPALIGPKSKPIALADVLTSQHGALSRMQQTDRELENVQLVPVLDLLCDEVVCKVDVEGKLMYSDDNHLSSYGASLLYSRIASALSLRP